MSAREGGRFDFITDPLSNIGERIQQTGQGLAGVPEAARETFTERVVEPTTDVLQGVQRRQPEAPADDPLAPLVEDIPTAGEVGRGVVDFGGQILAQERELQRQLDEMGAVGGPPAAFDPRVAAELLSADAEIAGVPVGRDALPEDIVGGPVPFIGPAGLGVAQAGQAVRAVPRGARGAFGRIPRTRAEVQQFLRATDRGQLGPLLRRTSRSEGAPLRDPSDIRQVGGGRDPFRPSGPRRVRDPRGTREEFISAEFAPPPGTGMTARQRLAAALSGAAQRGEAAQAQLSQIAARGTGLASRAFSPGQSLGIAQPGFLPLLEQAQLPSLEEADLLERQTEAIGATLPSVSVQLSQLEALQELDLEASELELLQRQIPISGALPATLPRAFLSQPPFSAVAPALRAPRLRLPTPPRFGAPGLRLPGVPAPPTPTPPIPAVPVDGGPGDASESELARFTRQLVADLPDPTDVDDDTVEPDSDPDTVAVTADDDGVVPGETLPPLATPGEEPAGTVAADATVQADESPPPLQAPPATEAASADATGGVAALADPTPLRDDPDDFPADPGAPVDSVPAPPPLPADPGPGAPPMEAFEDPAPLREESFDDPLPAPPALPRDVEPAPAPLPADEGFNDAAPPPLPPPPADTPGRASSRDDPPPLEKPP